MKATATALKSIFRLLVLWVFASVCQTVWAADAWRVQGPQEQEIRDERSGVVWRRCIEGMYWDGNGCAGKAVALSWGDARARASAMAQVDGRPWQLPTTAQLRELAILSRAKPTAYTAMFPQAPDSWYWSGNSTIDQSAVNAYTYDNVRRGINESNVNRVAFLHAWAVKPGGHEEPANMPKRNVLYVRLVLPIR